MSRYRRKYSKIGIYHLMLRDNERKDIFIDEEDKRAIKKFINYSNKYEEKSFLEIKNIEINEENVKGYINRYLVSRSLKKRGLEKRETIGRRENLIQQLLRKSYFSKRRRIAILFRINRETVRKLSKEPSL